MTSFMISGNVSKAAKTRQATDFRGNKTFVTDFHVAVNDGTPQYPIVTYYKVTLWGQTGANLEKYLTVGKEVDVKGIPGQEKAWLGEDGMAHSGNLIIRQAQVTLRGKKATAEPVDCPVPDVEADEDIPFQA